MSDSGRMPSPRALTAFGLDGADTEALPGGDEVSIVGAGIVLKRVQGSEVAIWSQALLGATQAIAEFRLPRPIQTNGGNWEVDGWIATEFVEGLESLRHDPAAIVQVGESLSDVLTAALAVDAGPVRQRQDRWAQADRFVWGEETMALGAEAADLAAILRSRMSHNRDASVVVHGDLSGNVFVDPVGVPVVLDFSPYIRPKRYASAIVVADNLLWYGGDPALAQLIDHDEDSLARALLFRMASEQLATDRQDLTAYRRTLTSLGWLATS